MPHNRLLGKFINISHKPQSEDLLKEAAQLWKDASKGRALLCCDKGGDLLNGGVSVPMTRVPR